MGSRETRMICEKNIYSTIHQLGSWAEIGVESREIFPHFLTRETCIDVNSIV